MTEQKNVVGEVAGTVEDANSSLSHPDLKLLLFNKLYQGPVEDELYFPKNGYCGDVDCPSYRRIQPYDNGRCEECKKSLREYEE